MEQQQDAGGADAEAGPQLAGGCLCPLAAARVLDEGQGGQDSRRRTEDRRGPRAEVGTGARGQQAAGQRFPRAADSPAGGGRGPEWDCSSCGRRPGGGHGGAEGRQRQQVGRKRSLPCSPPCTSLASAHPRPSLPRTEGGWGPACQDHPAPSPLLLRPPLPQAGSGHEILSKTFPLQNNPSKYVFGNRLLIRTGRS